MPQSLRVPKRIFFGEHMNTFIANLIANRNSADSTLHNPDSSLRKVLGYPVPNFQRPIVWTDEQCIRFIQSVYKGVYLGLFVYNDALIEAPNLNGLLIDGQQRLRAIKRYVDSEFAVPGEDGKEYFYGDLTKEERAHFERITFGFQVLQLTTEEEVRRVYNLLNFGGTPHQAHEMA